MPRRFPHFATAALAAALLAWLPAGAAAQDASFRTPDGHPDLQGVWNLSLIHI